MFSAVKEHLVLPASIPGFAVALMAFTAVAIWVGSHWLSKRLAPERMKWRTMMFALRLCVGCGAIWMVMLALMHRSTAGHSLVLLTTSWPLWPLVVGGALAVEALLSMYSLEKSTLSRRAGRTLVALRVALPLALVAMLAQPVMPRDLFGSDRRIVAVLIDESASMRIGDPQMSAGEKLRLAQALSVPAARRPLRLDEAQGQLERLRLAVSAQGEWLSQVGAGGAKQEQLDARRELLEKTYREGLKTLDAQIESLSAGSTGKVALPESAKVALMDVKATLSRGIRDNLQEAVKITGKDNASRLAEQSARLADLTSAVAKGLSEITPKLSALAASADDSYWNSLDQQQREQIDAAVSKTRLELARSILSAKTGQDAKSSKSLLDKIGDKYALKVYRFAADAGEVDLAKWNEDGRALQQPPAPRLTSSVPASSADAADSQPASSPASEPSAETVEPRLAQTDLAGAVQKAMSDAPGGQLAGVIVLTDARHNAPSSVQDIAQRLAQQRVPLSTILMGSTRPPCDAAVLSVQAPKVVYLKDRMYADAEVKLDGLKGRPVRVSLTAGDKEVAFKELTPASDSLRTHVELSDEPQAVGMQTYQVRVESFDGEISSANNVYPLTVSVTDEQTKLLIVDSRPRWEFRYLKNLFADRDKTVKLQYVLLEPDKIDGQAPRAMVHASVSAPKGETEATALPLDEKEWLKFDVVILGDVGPGILDAAQQEMLRKFVADRGGSLVVIGGRFHMPHEFTGSVLESLLPVTFRAGTGAPDEMFRFALTEAGSSSVLMRLSVDPQANEKVWLGVPDVNWRNLDVLSAKPGATVLSYAMPLEPPAFLQGDATPQTLALRREFEQSRPLVVTQNVAMGQVMYLNTDRTWRLRYRVGDTYHHKFWGQVLRWATAGKLPAGTDFVKLGTDQARYSPHTKVQARAKIVRRDFTPLDNAEAAVAVYNSADGKLVLRRRLAAVADSAGMYQADLGELPGGQYRMELESPEAREILAEDQVEKVTTEFSVDTAGMEELNDLSADRGLAGSLASATAGVVVEPSDASGVLESMGPEKQEMFQKRQWVLWDSPAILAIVVILVTAEWVIRKKVGLP